MEEVLGKMPMPDSASNHPLVIALFEIGPVEFEGHLTWRELESWQRLMGIELEPWEAIVLIDLSRAFFQQKQESKSISSLCPWPKGRNIWKYVQDEKHKKQREAETARLKDVKEKATHGSHKRHRNPPTG